MIKRLIACCGLDCDNCDARIATVRNDDELREKTAQKWSVMNNAPEITAATINCMGCRADGAKFAYCSDYCEIRKCVHEKDLILAVTVQNWRIVRSSLLFSACSRRKRKSSVFDNSLKSENFPKMSKTLLFLLALWLACVV